MDHRLPVIKFFSLYQFEALDGMEILTRIEGRVRPFAPGRNHDPQCLEENHGRPRFLQDKPPDGHAPVYRGPEDLDVRLVVTFLFPK